MKATYRDTMTIDELYQAFIQDREFFAQNKITHVRSVYFYFTPCDQSGEPVDIRDQNGRLVEGYETSGIYRSAADQYDAPLEPRTLSRTTALKGKGGGKAGGSDKRRCKPK